MMFRNRLQNLLLTGLLCCAWQAQAQQLPFFTQYRNYSELLNPAAVTPDFMARGQNFSFGASHRSQWTELEGAPTTSTLRGSWLGTDYGGFVPNVGGFLMHDQTGPTGFTGIYARAGGLISGDAEDGGIGLGLSFGMVQYRLKTNELVLRDEGDILPGETQAQWNPDVGLGVFGFTRLGNDNIVYGGVSVPQVLGLDLAFRNADGEFETTRVQHFYAQAGSYLFLDDDRFIEPSVWVRYVNGSDISVDLNFRYQMSPNLFVGLGGNLDGAGHLEAGLLLGDTYNFENTLQIGYSFTRWFSDFGPNLGGTHEINISVALER